MRAEVKDRKRFGGVDLPDLMPALAGIGAGTSSRGAFNFANAAQFFGGSNMAERQLKQGEKIEAAVLKVVDAVGKLPIARIT